MSSTSHNAHRRGPWSNSEDAYLMQLVQTHGPLNWVRIAQTLGSRTPKQCRERYHQNLKPSLNHNPITPEEGLEIERLVHQIGKRWAEIARRLHGRSDNAVKNWWNGSQNRRKRLDKRRQSQPTAFTAEPYSRASLSMVSSSMSHPPSPLQIRNRSWVEPPLPSPCTSESADSDAGSIYTISNYTTSPGRPPPLSLRTHSIALPPLRVPSYGSSTNSSSSRLPSILTVTSPTFDDRLDSQPRLPPLTPGMQLPTAPSSPRQSQSRSHSLSQPQPQEPQRSPIADRDSRMNLSTLLG